MKKIAMMVFLAPLAIAGCLGPQPDATDQAANDVAATDEATSELAVTEQALATSAAISVNSVTLTCNSGWPGTRGCVADIPSPTDIFPLPGFPLAQVISGSGDLGHGVFQTGPRTLRFVATIAEGDLFNPGKNTTSYIVFWARN